MGGNTGLKSIMPGNKAIGLMVVRGFGLFLTVSGMVGIALIAGPLNHILKDLTFTPIFDSKLYAFLICLSMTVVGGALDFFTNEGLKALERQKMSSESIPRGEPARG
jgi:hypothetical protein